MSIPKPNVHRPLVAGHPHLDTVLAAGESPRHLLLDYLCRPAREDRALTETYANQLVDAVVDRHRERAVESGQAQRPGDGSQAARMTASNLAGMHAQLAREAQDIADAATRFAADVDRGIAVGAYSQLAQAVQQFLIRAVRYDAMKDTASLYDSELTPKEDQ